MDRRPSRSPSLAERTGSQGRAAAGPPPSPLRRAAAERSEEQAPAQTGAGARHCWVVDGASVRPRAPGLLVEWRQLDGAWQGRVAYVVGGDGDTTLVEAWLPASQLLPAAGP